MYVLSVLFGADSAFTASILDYSEDVRKCEERLMQRKAPEWSIEASAIRSSKDKMMLLKDLGLPKIWPFYINICSDVSIASSSERVLIPGA